MKSIEDIKIIGLDPDRPPRIQTMPCIDLFFQLNEQAPEAWCSEFNLIAGKPQYGIKIKPEEGLFIETWVREADEITAIFEKVKMTVSACNRAYEEMVAAAGRKNAEPTSSKTTESPRQIYLNEIINNLNFE